MNIVPEPEKLFSPSSRVMVVLAHEDDEVTFAGLIQRLSAWSRFVWVTNGDGLSDQLRMPDADYADLRREETVRAMEVAGVRPDRLRFLGHSEKHIYARLASLDEREPKFGRAESLSYFKDMAAQVTAEVATFRPDFVITHAWQGGQPEHDLVHLMAVLAAAKVPGCTVYEVPEYELMYSVFLRFPPWHRGPVHELALTADELDIKKRMLDCYVTQKKGMLLSKALMLAGGAAERARALVFQRKLLTRPFAAREQFAQVPPGRNYRACPHIIDHLEYIGDDWQKKSMSFSRMVLPVVCAIEQ